MVDLYTRDHHKNHATEVRRHTRCRSLREAVDLAASCESSDGKRHSHQRRIPSKSLAKARKRLLAADLTGPDSFDALHDEIARLVDNIDRIGELTIYDIALRIGAFRGLAPKRVYLHRGTRAGARALGLGRGRATLEMAELPKEFLDLDAAEAEDCLCIYKDELRSAVAGRRAPRRR